LPNYLFFPSREYGSGTTLSLSELAGRWLDEVFGKSEATRPGVMLMQVDVDRAGRLGRLLRVDRVRRLVAINFGVGENVTKRVGEDFETLLVKRLLREGNGIVLDKGAGTEEARLIDELISGVIRSEDGRRVRSVELNESNLGDYVNAPELNADTIVWNGRIGMLAALIGESDLYIGYDSAGQHIAAALGVPCVDVFAGHDSQRFVDRWRASGKGHCEVIAVDMSNVANVESLVDRILRQVDGK
jgi:ADP-heptose:LPS heptosyltransferase